MSGKKITPSAERGLSTAIQRDRERRTGHNGERPDEVVGHGFEVHLAVAQQDIQAGTTGPMNIWTGKKGQEADQGVTVQDVLSRFVKLSNGQQALIGEFDQGFEVIHELQTGSGGSLQPCNCKTCVQDQPRYWTFSIGFNQQQTFALIGPNGGPWTSPPFSWGGANTNLTWTLTAPGPYGIQLNGFSADAGVQFRCPSELWASQCTNTMTLFNPTSQAAGNVPCTICVIPSDQTVCGNCSSGPTSASFSLWAQQCRPSSRRPARRSRAISTPAASKSL